MTRKILIPLDGSPFSEQVLDHIPALCPATDTELLLLNVVEAGRYHGMMGPDSLLTFDLSYWRGEANAYLNEMQIKMHAQGYHVRTDVAEGDVASTICELANAHNVDLIAMATHGRSGMSLWMLGSVADRVVRSADHPVFLVRPTEERHGWHLSTILVPLDGSALAEEALVPAGELAEEHDGEVILVQSVEALDYWVEAQSDLHGFPTVLSVEEQENMAQRYLDGVARKLTQRGIRVRTRVTHGYAPSAIADLSEEAGIDLVVMGTHGRSGPGRWLFGSVAEKTVRLVNCPVLLMRSGQPAGLWRRSLATSAVNHVSAG